MIAWMQKRKKYLVVTIWVSTIAFVGAGFVGWGDFDFGFTNRNSAAIVGKNAISRNELSQAYSNAFNGILQQRGGNFSQEDAEKMGLETAVLHDLIRQQMLLNYAEDLGIEVSDQEIFGALAKEEAFLLNGSFSKEQYEQVLRNARLTPKDYEEGIRREMKIDKLVSMIRVGITHKEARAVASSYLMRDEVFVQVVNAPKNIAINEAQLREYWEKNRANFKSETEFRLSVFAVPVGDVGASEADLRAYWEQNRGNYRDANDMLQSYDDAAQKVAKDYAFAQVRKEALQRYVAVKKGGVEASETLAVTQSNSNLTADVMAQVVAAKAGDVLRPYEDAQRFVILRVDEIAAPRELSFEEAKSRVAQDFAARAKVDFLARRSQELVGTIGAGVGDNGAGDSGAAGAKNAAGTGANSNLATANAKFNGESLGFIGVDYAGKIANLTEQESAYFVEQLFSQNAKKGFILIGDKSVVFEVRGQEMLDETKWERYKESLQGATITLKNIELNQDLLGALQRRYEVKITK